jgi:multiple sugar transport system permease protein
MNMKNKFDLFAYFNKPERAAYIFLLPSLIIFAVFVLMPLLASLLISMLDIDIFLENIEFNGLRNFEKLIYDERFWNALKNTVYFTVFEVPLQVIFALLIAVYVQKNTTFRKFLRSCFYIPVVCSMTAMGIVWSMLMDPTLGTIPYMLRFLGLSDVGFLKDPLLAMPTIILVTVWKNFGLSMIILVAGIQSIPDVYYEVAELDGASKWNQFRNITIPLIIPTLGFCAITNTIGSLQMFDQAYVMTQGGPVFKTETLVQYIYTRGFSVAPYDLGYASAIAEILFLMIAVIAIVMYQFFIREETVDI